MTTPIRIPSHTGIARSFRILGIDVFAFAPAAAHTLP
jgi:hypothetical protein